jgi:hypothetical protein
LKCATQPSDDPLRVTSSTPERCAPTLDLRRGMSCARARWHRRAGGTIDRLDAHRKPLGVRSDPTPPPRPRFDVAPPAPGRLPADGPARFGQQPAVPPVFDPVSLNTESLADLDKSNRLMLRVLVRHGAPAPCSRSERRCPWEPAPAAIGYPFGGTRIRAGFVQPRSGPRPEGRGRRETARRRGGDQSGGPPGAKRSPGCTGKPGDRPARPPARSAWLPDHLPGKPARPDPRAEGLTGRPTPRRSPTAPPLPTCSGPRL